MILEIIPDWRELWTKAEVERELINFAFNGIGWYMDGNGGAILVSDSSEAENCIQRATAGNDKRYWFYYWSASPIESLKWAADFAPLIEDLRKP